MTKQIVMASAVLALVGCSAAGLMNAGDCGTADWYQYGWRDGIESGRSSLEDYRPVCGASVNEARYAKGVEDGRWERSKRKF